ncbi:3-dehydroquinate synthase [Zunongwangia profunda]|uniref:3-dehydroquinate synthase n=2 Tax=Zunongwangia profunda TaxID=398743 RepID=D5BFD7_ZUNPS|nr:3-dehydroquinate synthase [Zunongwangia profunda]ADF53035.1 3-dehydroquinate synthase [Zunongwangia profunda SM-A87]MAS72661.1 3-dehydroquinate synthase [Zunongwangia sp.]HAJ81069.1 3-dehydroquinate synthase [Zunongwangia profunda]HCV80366.1 3-dehydroquinate synthase [Zunongwangia profunda]|tara:strand:+ start:1375 stop:2439 length:1065 start_codon:yes stop_codon:yes gene_type:complete
MENTAKGTVFYKEEAYQKINDYLVQHTPSKIFILVDTNTHEHCLPGFLPKISTATTIEIIEIEAGEPFKNLDTCLGVWQTMSDLEGDRKSLMINLGGGVVTDLGGFVASTFKRGINYINVPTTLLAMVDASVGGKTGVDLGNLKNQIGIISNAEMVIVDSDYLATLPSEEMRSGLAEILKHGLIADEAYWEKVGNLSELTLNDLDDIIRVSVGIKAKVVAEDPYENGLRKTLNYGHTLGHAIESYCLTHTQKKTLLHGEAVALGIILATYISKELKDFPSEKLDSITKRIVELYGKVEFSKNDIDAIIDLMKYDKKNEAGKINFVLLKDIGETEIDCQVPNNIIFDAFEFYKNA